MGFIYAEKVKVDPRYEASLRTQNAFYDAARHEWLKVVRDLGNIFEHRWRTHVYETLLGLRAGALLKARQMLIELGVDGETEIARYIETIDLGDLLPTAECP
jgi:hypothetical protein